jgi:hypothetical protein
MSWRAKKLTPEDMQEIAIECRCIEGELCSDCAGWGVKLYGSTATWRGGIGGQAMTTDVCDVCWGSGDKAQPWPAWPRR